MTEVEKFGQATKLASKVRNEKHDKHDNLGVHTKHTQFTHKATFFLLDCVLVGRLTRTDYRVEQVVNTQITRYSQKVSLIM